MSFLNFSWITRESKLTSEQNKSPLKQLQLTIFNSFTHNLLSAQCRGRNFDKRNRNIIIKLNSWARTILFFSWISSLLNIYENICNLSLFISALQCLIMFNSYYNKIDIFPYQRLVVPSHYGCNNISLSPSSLAGRCDWRNTRDSVRTRTEASIIDTLAKTFLASTHSSKENNCSAVRWMPGDLSTAPGFTSLSQLSLTDTRHWHENQDKWLLARNPDRRWLHGQQAYLPPSP